jgi:restriction system protein
MAVPGFQDMFIHFLKCLEDGETRHTSVIREFVSEEMNLSDEDREEMIPSGQSTRLANRVGWARTHLRKAGLIEQIKRGHYRITDAGKELLVSPPENLNLNYLDTIPSHKNWLHASKKEKNETGTIGNQEASTPPNERIEEAYKELNDELASSLLEAMATMDAYAFEQLVIDVLFAMGYGGSRKEAARVTKKSNDEGIDGVINEDRLGLDVIYVQAKRWQNTIGRKEIQSFVGALAGKQANKGVFITTSDYNRNAIEYADMVSQKIILIDGKRLADLMIEYQIGVSPVRNITIKRLDTDYFEDE